MNTSPDLAAAFLRDGTPAQIRPIRRTTSTSAPIVEGYHRADTYARRAPADPPS
jgi:hypothetical protein